MFLQVAVNVPIHRTFEYSYISPTADNDTQTLIGCRVVVNFRHKETIGIVIAENTTSQFKPEAIKPIVKLIDTLPLFSTDIVKLLTWATCYYHHPIGEIFATAIPTMLRNGEEAALPSIKGWQYTGKDISSLHRSPACLKAIELLKIAPRSVESLKELGIKSPILNKLQQQEFITPIDYRQLLPNWREQPIIINNALELNDEQQLAYNTIQAQPGFHVFLLNGVTGSGKTEVYLQLIADCVRNGKQALVLVPEINLTPQTVTRFYQRFNVPVVCLHSNINKTEKLEAFLTAANDEAAILIGTRSAIFTPLPNLGIIIVDEEHDSSYRQAEGFRYNCRDLAVVRAMHKQIPIVLGSATPSLESLHNVMRGKFQQLMLHNRAGNASMVTTEVIDMRKQLLQHSLSQRMINEIYQEIVAGNQVLVMLNRRGYAPMVMCHDCGYTFTCQNCSCNIYLHTHENYLSCHHCETKYEIPRTCPKCGSPNIITVGLGIEQLYDELQALFPQVAMIRIDRDTTSRKGSLETYLNDVNENKYQLLVGTQMLAKGHHFPNVTLVCIVDIDSSLLTADFRAPEKLAQLIVQVSGRAGRATKKGRVLLQTHHPNHPLLVTLLNEGYQAFASMCLQERQAHQLPPVAFQGALKADAVDRNDVILFITDAYIRLRKACANLTALQIVRPYFASIDRRQNRYHMIMLFNSLDRNLFGHCANCLVEILPNIDKRQSVHAVIEIDPQDII